MNLSFSVTPMVFEQLISSVLVFGIMFLLAYCVKKFIGEG